MDTENQSDKQDSGTESMAVMGTVTVWRRNTAVMGKVTIWWTDLTDDQT